ncbi:MAG: hypothetical protein RLZZ151_882, partial [Pseudomonadota bacterium]
ERFERPTLWFVAKYSIQLSYERTDLNYLLLLLQLLGVPTGNRTPAAAVKGQCSNR